MAKKEQLIKDFTNALTNVQYGEQIVNIDDDGDDHIAISIELDSWRGNEYYIFGFKGYADGETIDDKAYIMLEKRFVDTEVFDEYDGIEGTVQVIADIVSKQTDSKPDEEGVPAE